MSGERKLPRLFLLQNADLSKMAPPECIYLGGSKAFVCSLHNFSKFYLPYFPHRKICKEKIQIDTIVNGTKRVDSFGGANL